MKSTPRTRTSSCMSRLILPSSRRSRLDVVNTGTHADPVHSAQMDATLNDVPPSAPFKVQGFPTLKFKPAGGLEFIDYNGDRSLESLIEFVETNKKSVAADGADDAEYEDDDAEVVEHDEL